MFQIIQSLNNVSIQKLKLTILVISILIATQVQYIQHGWINPDSILYLEAAKLFAIGLWKEGFDIFQWPFYSLWIAATHKLTGLNIHQSAQLLNVFFFAITTISFINIIALAGGNKITIVAGALILFSSSYVVGDVLEMLMRDEGFWAFYLTSLVFFIQFYKHQRFQDALLWQVSAIFAMLFRIEAITYLVFLPLILLLNTHYTLPQRIVQLAKANLFNIVIAFGVFVAVTSIEELSIENFGRLKEVFNANLWHEFTHTFLARANIMSEDVLGHYLDEFAVLGLLLTFLFVMFMKTISAAGIINVVLATFALKRRHIYIDPHACKVLGSVALISIINMGLILTKVFVLSTRYVVGLGFIIMLFASFYLACLLWQKTRSTDKNLSLKNWFVYAIMLLMLLSLVKNVLPKSNSARYAQNSAIWVKNHSIKGDAIYANENRLKYYANLKFTGKYTQELEWQRLQAVITNNTISRYRYLLIEQSANRPEQTNWLNKNLISHKEIKRFYGPKNKKYVVIYEMAESTN